MEMLPFHVHSAESSRTAMNIKPTFLSVVGFPNVDRQPYAHALIKSPSFHRRLLREIDGSRIHAMLLRE